MRKIILGVLAASLLVASPCFGSVSIVNKTVYANGGSTGTDTITIPATTAQDTLVVAMMFNSVGPPTCSLTDSAAQSLTIINYSLAGSGSSVAVAYLTNVPGGVTFVSFVCGANPYAIVYELTPAILDDREFSGSVSAGNPVVGPAITGSQTSNFFLTVAAAVTNTVSSVSVPWTLEAPSNHLNGNGLAYFIGGSGSQQAIFGPSNSQFSAIGIDFQENVTPCAGHYNSFVINNLGTPTASSIRVCQEGSTGTPCTPLATIYSDVTLHTPQLNPFNTDSNGNFDFYAARAFYDVQISAPTITAYTLPNVDLGVCSTGGGGGGGGGGNGGQRVCALVVGADNGPALVNADLGPQGEQCYVPFAATVQEIMIGASAATPSVTVGKNHAGSVTNLVSAPLQTAAAGGLACSNISGALGFNGLTTCSPTLQNTGLAAGDFIELVSGTAGGGPQNLHSVQISDGAIHIYAMNDTSGTSATDTGSSPSAGTYTGGFTLNQPPLEPDLLHSTTLNGTTGNVALTFAETPSPTAGFSVEILVKQTALQTSNSVGYVLIGNDQPDISFNGYELASGKNIVNFIVGNNVTSFLATYPSPLSINVVHLVQGTFDGQIARLYIDGALVAVSPQMTAGSSYHTGGFNSRIGRDPAFSDAGTFFPGGIQSAAFYGTALTTTQIANHWNAVSRMSIMVTFKPN